MRNRGHHSGNRYIDKQENISTTFSNVQIYIGFEMYSQWFFLFIARLLASAALLHNLFV